VVGEDRDAERGRQPQALAFILEAHLRDRAGNAVGQHAQHLVGDVRDQDREFVSAQAREYLIAAHLPADLAGHPDQHRVAGAVAEGIVDVLEIVQVEEQQGDARIVALGVRDHARKLLVEPVAVIEAGQRIALGQVDQLVRGLALARDVLEQPQPPDRPAVDVLHRV
jgi:hypothetical protein